MTARFPCFECGEPFDTRDEMEAHWHRDGHGPQQVALDAIDKARYSIMGEAAPPPESAYHAPPLMMPQSRRRRFKVLRGGRR